MRCVRFVFAVLENWTCERMQIEMSETKEKTSGWLLQQLGEIISKWAFLFLCICVFHEIFLRYWLCFCCSPKGIVYRHSVLERNWVKGSNLSKWLPQGERGPPKESKSRWIEILHGGAQEQIFFSKFFLDYQFFFSGTKKVCPRHNFRSVFYGKIFFRKIPVIFSKFT